MSRRDASGLPVDRFGRAVGAPGAGVDRSIEMTAEFGMDSPDRSDRPPDSRGHGLAGALDRIADQSGSTAEPEVAGHRLGESLTLLAGERGSLAVTHRFGIGLVAVELVEPIADLAARPLIERPGQILTSRH